MILMHGTTRKRAEKIVANGPDPHYRDPSEEPHKDGFSTYTLQANQTDLGTSRRYALLKHRAFSSEGGPVILKIEVPDAIIMCAVDEYYPLSKGVVVFNHGKGIAELLKGWPEIAKTAIIEEVV